ncbi:MAG: pyruvate kinase [Candidatus Tectomicrobia bacterium]|uniref:Pyruvate kinase n=1 Tax=Tectimicrobiota bacterium TaxID=2528274 RepID=A0A933LP78_UNCTE|nr:pyruvate kinase [Candidatus Tectomicrobia bacterium]
MRRTKIICTLGPSSNSREIIEEMVLSGMDIARLNFSHGAHQEFKELISLIREIAARLNRTVAIIQDLQGVKLRIGTFKGGAVFLKPGQTFTLSMKETQGDEELASVNYPDLAGYVQPGDKILIDDGLVQLEVVEHSPDMIKCRVIEGGMVKDHKGVNLPGVGIKVALPTAKDIKDLHFGIENGVDYVAVSYVTGAADLIAIREIINSKKADIPVIAKLERAEAIDHLDEILQAADGLMVARGDLGVELPLEIVPILQKKIIKEANQSGIPVITATQMLESMVKNPRPTRAEVSDVANAIFDGTDALMLSAETSAGDYPVKSVQLMAKIALISEENMDWENLRSHSKGQTEPVFSDVISEAACEAAKNLRAKAIVAFTQSGFTARLISKYRPMAPIIAFTQHERVKRRLALYWGVIPYVMGLVEHTDEMILKVEQALKEQGLAKSHDDIVILSGAPIFEKGTTNLLKLHRLG